MITVYSKNNCPYCVQAKNLLKQKGVAFEEINIEETPSAREFIV
jgi:glutaredoxin